MKIKEIERKKHITNDMLEKRFGAIFILNFSITFKF